MGRDNTDNKKMKIVMLGHKRIPSREGGIEIVVEELASRMVAEGCCVTCYNRRGHHVSGAEFDSEQLSEYKGIKIKTVPTINRKGLAAMTSSFFAAIKAAVGDYDIVHIHAEGPAAMCWIPKLFGKRVIVTIHGLDWQREKWNNGFGSKYIKFGEKCAVKFADEIIVLSEGVKKYFAEIYGRKTVFIPNGVNRPAKREPDEIKKLCGLEKDSYILFLGRLVPEKGLRYLVQAYKGLETDKKLVLAGGGSDTDAFEKELKQSCKDIKNRVIFTGFIQGKVLDELYSNCYLYVLPSDLEGMPLSLLEAMSYGNCCVISDIEECVSVIEDEEDSQRAAVFKRGNALELRDKLQTLCDDEKLVKKYRAGASDFISGKYGWDNAVCRTLALYRKSECKLERKARTEVGRMDIAKDGLAKKRYGSIDGLRTVAAIGIVMMHMRFNNDYHITGYVYEKIIPSFTNFVFLFMTVSAFGMCCGYYGKILNREISVSDFYGKRFRKVFPFFALLVLLDILISPSVNSLYEGFADLTLLFGLLPGCGGIEVIGVGWFLGLVFVFYLCFPFFCFLIENRKRAWVAFGISLAYNFACAAYFDVDRSNILYSGCFFLSGGMAYLYRNEIVGLMGRKMARWILLGTVAVSVFIYYLVGGNTVTWLLVSTTLLVYAVAAGGKGLENRVTRFFSGISMEIYISHMIIFRVLEKLHLNTMLGDGWVQYVFTVVIVVAGTSVFAVVIQRVIGIAEKKMSRHFEVKDEKKAGNMG